MILAAGLTPAWQQILCFRQLELGEVNRAEEAHWCASGKVLNTGMALASLGVLSHTLSPAGGWSGSALRAEFAERSLNATWIPTAAPTRICTTVLDQSTDMTTELVENAASLSDEELAFFIDEFQELVEEAETVVVTGSLPRGTPDSFYRVLLERTPCPIVLDARGPELLAALSCKPRVVKPNREELARTVGRPLGDRAAVLSAMRELIERGAQAVIVTHGKDAVWLMEGGDAWELTPPEILPVVNPIGCGDCLAAGVALGLSCGDAMLDAVRVGMAAAADNLTQLLPARLSLPRVEAIAKRIGTAQRIAL